MRQIMDKKQANKKAAAQEQMPNSKSAQLPNSSLLALMNLQDAGDSVSHSADHQITLDDEMKERLTAHFGIDANTVKVVESQEVADMGAQAYARGNVVKFAPGKFKPDTRSGLESIGHEFAHIKQQATGGYSANVEGLNVHYDAGTEKASDAAGKGFAESLGSETVAAPALGPVQAPVSAQAAPIQGGFTDWVKGLFSSKKKKPQEQMTKGGLRVGHEKEKPGEAMRKMRSTSNEDFKAEKKANDLDGYVPWGFSSGVSGANKNDRQIGEDFDDDWLDEVPEKAKKKRKK